MNDETTTNPTEEAAQAATDTSAVGSKTSETDKIMNDLNQLGQKVAAAIQAVWDSEERHKAEDEIRKALRMAGDNIDRVAEDVRKSDVAKDVQTQAARAAEAVQKSDVTKQLKQSILTGLRRFNEELSDFLDKSNAEEATTSAGEAAAEAGKAAAAAGEAAADAASAAVQEAAEKAKGA